MTSRYTKNRRRLGILPVSVETELRLLGYGAIGAVAGVTWRPQRLILLSHMRAGSSLTSQLLSAHPDIAGFGELHLAYRRPRDLLAMRGKVVVALRSARRNERFVLDKILHDYLLAPDDAGLIAPAEDKVVFLVRQPAQTLESLVASFGFSSERAGDYYVGRLGSLRRIARELAASKECAALRYVDLVERTDGAFGMLEHFLELDGELSETYRPMARGNDPSANLQAGRILRGTKVAKHRAPVAVSEIERCEAAFEETWRVLTDVCTTVSDS